MNGEERARPIESRRTMMNADPVRVACIGMGWWSDVLADAIQRSGKLQIVSCYTRTEEKRAAFAKKLQLRSRGLIGGDPRRSLRRGLDQHHAQQRSSGDLRGGGEGGETRVRRQAHRQYPGGRPRDRPGLPGRGRAPRRRLSAAAGEPFPLGPRGHRGGSLWNPVSGGKPISPGTGWGGST